MKAIVYSVFIVLYALVSFFGLGPVLYADGSNQERLWTFLAVLGIYAVLTAMLILFRNKWTGRR
ncbi:hypothetical protein SY83_06950 [Paenibacillus swuensis]|uniref:Uncharacterized protein n=1 Tax=Paenibacillus swuensis TaxID=1178515 RepID=A0A172TG77_9BACL|nr:hypothetical protein [Paenibacillus swuensis]ANE46065.1 hypothetical protein SY83_06950 [Paenibacillus swuensis]